MACIADHCLVHKGELYRRWGWQPQQKATLLSGAPFFDAEPNKPLATLLITPQPNPAAF